MTVVTGRPPSISGSYLVIELSNRCNLSCVHCAVSEQGHAHHTTTGHMRIEMIESLLKDLQQNQISFDTVILFWLGEPTLHPYFTTVYRLLVRAAVRHQTFSHIELHTNAIRLREGLQQTLLNQAAVRQTIHLTVDAIHPETYQKVKGRDQLDTVMRNIDGFLSYKARLNSQWPRIVIQYIVGSNNASEVPAFISHWGNRLDEHCLPWRVMGGEVPSGTDVVLFFRQLDCPTPEEQARENAVFEETLRLNRIPLPKQPAKQIEDCQSTMRPCSGFWKSPVIYWNGQVTTCTRDNLMENVIGNIAEMPFSKLWFGSKINQWRRAVAKGDYSELTLCQSCFIPKSLNHTDIRQEDIVAMKEYTEQDP